MFEARAIGDTLSTVRINVKNISTISRNKTGALLTAIGKVGQEKLNEKSSKV